MFWLHSRLYGAFINTCVLGTQQVFGAFINTSVLATQQVYGAFINTSVLATQQVCRAFIKHFCFGYTANVNTGNVSTPPYSNTSPGQKG